MSALLASTVQSRPFAVPVKWNAIRAFVHLIQLLQVLVFDCARSSYIEESERDLILGVWFRKEVFECTPIEEVELARTPSIGNSEKNRILFTFDLVLYGND